MVGGNIPGVTRTLSIDIYDQVQGLNYSGAARTSAMLLIVSFVILSIVYGFNRKVWLFAADRRHRQDVWWRPAHPCFSADYAWSLEYNSVRTFRYGTDNGSSLHRGPREADGQENSLRW